MRSKLLVSTATAAILSGLVFASAQEMPRGGKQEGTMQNQGSPGGAQRGERRQGTRERAQGNQGQRDQGQRDQSKGKQAQPKPDRDRDRQTTGQGQRDQDKARQAQPKQAQPTDRRGSDQAVGQDRDRHGRRDGDDRAQGRVDLSVEQRTRIRQSVFARSDVPRVNSVNFSVRVGTIVPTRVRIVAVPAAIVEIRPQFRGHQYFVVRDEIVIVDDRRHIVAVIPVDTARGGGGGAAVSSGAQFVDLSSAEIREVQLVLVERGFDVEVDGLFGPRTRRALTQFQQRQGLKATGRFDSRTIAELGIRSSGESSTTGQGGSDRRSPANRGASEPQSGSMGRQDDRTGAQQSGEQSDRQSKNGSSTTGQGGAEQRSPANQGTTGGAMNPGTGGSQGEGGSGANPSSQPEPRTGGGTGGSSGGR